jgi:CCR4-NOT transcription complex subunit 7/8
MELYRKELWNQSSINLLINSGINFDKLASSGIDHQTFAEHFITSGLILNKDVHWYGFHTDHDFAYLLKMLSGQLLPSNE